MAKKQTRRSISVSRNTYERLKAFCETNHISMSQFVETRVGDYLGDTDVTLSVASSASSMMTQVPAPRPLAPSREVKPAAVVQSPRAIEPRPTTVPMTSAAARFAIEPPPPIIKPKADTAAPKPAEKRPDQIFTF
jgi:hypothetical protein